MLEKVVAKTTTETSEAESSSTDEEKGTEANDGEDPARRRRPPRRRPPSKPAPDAVAAVAQLDVQHRARSSFVGGRAEDTNAGAIGDYHEKNKGKLVAPKSEGGKLTTTADRRPTMRQRQSKQTSTQTLRSQPRSCRTRPEERALVETHGGRAGAPPIIKVRALHAVAGESGPLVQHLPQAR